MHLGFGMAGALVLEGRQPPLGKFEGIVDGAAQIRVLVTPLQPVRTKATRPNTSETLSISPRAIESTYASKSRISSCVNVFSTLSGISEIFDGDVEMHTHLLLARHRRPHRRDEWLLTLELELVVLRWRPHQRPPARVLLGSIDHVPPQQAGVELRQFEGISAPNDRTA
jgi:hypothetical protein